MRLDPREEVWMHSPRYGIEPSPDRDEPTLRFRHRARVSRRDGGRRCFPGDHPRARVARRPGPGGTIPRRPALRSPGWPGLRPGAEDVLKMECPAARDSAASARPGVPPALPSSPRRGSETPPARAAVDLSAGPGTEIKAGRAQPCYAPRSTHRRSSLRGSLTNRPTRVADHPHALSLLAGPVPVDVHVPRPLDADHFPTHLAANPLGALDDPLADGHLLLDHRPLLHGDLLLADRDADLLDGLARRGLPLDDHLLPLHRDLDRPVLGDDLLADPDLARLHELLVGLQLLLADLDPRALGSPGRLVLRAKRLAVPQPPLLHGLDRLGPPAADSGRHRHEPRVDPWAEHLLLNLYRELSGLAIRRKDLVGHVTSLLHAYPVRRKLGSHHLSTWIGCGGAVAASRGRPRSRMTTARGGRARRGEGIRAPLSRRASRAEDRPGADPEARPAQDRAVRGRGPSPPDHFTSGRARPRGRPRPPPARRGPLPYAPRRQPARCPERPACRPSPPP